MDKRCYYCYHVEATARDHTKPVSAILPGPRKHQHLGLGKSTQVPACKECNSILGARMFVSMPRRMRYLLIQLLERDAASNRIAYLARLMDMSEGEEPAELPSKVDKRQSIHGDMVRVCLQCDAEYRTNKSVQKFCSDKCRNKFHFG